MSHSLLSVTKFTRLFVAGWAGWFLLHTAILYWYGFPLSIALVDSAVSNLLLMGTCVVLITALRFYLPQERRYRYIFALCLAITVMWFLVSRAFIRLFTDDVLDYKSFFTQSAPIKLTFGFLVTGSVALLTVIWYVMQDQQENWSRSAEAARLSKEAELYKLRQQLQPHFLFNSLNSINALIGIEPARARTMIHQLSDFLRGTLRREAEAWITVAEEIGHLQLYLEIEKVRFGHRLSTITDIPPSCATLRLPAMLLQPVVENAIKFGLYGTTESIVIHVHAEVHDGMLHIVVKNPFDTGSMIENKGTGFGLASLQRRLYLLFGRSDLLQTQTGDGLFTTTIQIPQTQ